MNKQGIIFAPGWMDNGDIGEDVILTKNTTFAITVQEPCGGGCKDSIHKRKTLSLSSGGRHTSDTPSLLLLLCQICYIPGSSVVCYDTYTAAAYYS